MKNLHIRSFAKINISLNITKKRDDGFHELDSVMLPISLHDSLVVSKLNNANDNFTLENTTAGRKTGISSTDAAMTYTQGGESFTIAKADANRYYTPNSSVTYTYGEETSSFTPAEVLDLRTPTLY